MYLQFNIHIYLAPAVYYVPRVETQYASREVIKNNKHPEGVKRHQATLGIC